MFATINKWSITILTRNGLDDQRPVIQGSDGLLEAAEGLGDIDVELHDKVDARSLKSGVLLLIQHNDDIARFEPGLLVTLAAEVDLLAVLHALVHCDLKNFALPRDLFAAALLAPQLGVDALAGAVAFAAHGLNLLHHTGP